MKLTSSKMYNQLINNITNLVQRAKENAFKAINNELIKANWEIGRYIVEYEQNGKEKAVYGGSLLSKLSKDLKDKNSIVSEIGIK